MNSLRILEIIGLVLAIIDFTGKSSILEQWFDLKRISLLKIIKSFSLSISGSFRKTSNNVKTIWNSLENQKNFTDEAGMIIIIAFLVLEFFIGGFTYSYLFSVFSIDRVSINLSLTSKTDIFPDFINSFTLVGLTVVALTIPYFKKSEYISTILFLFLLECIAGIAIYYLTMRRLPPNSFVIFLVSIPFFIASGIVFSLLGVYLISLSILIFLTLLYWFFHLMDKPKAGTVGSMALLVTLISIISSNLT